MPRILALVRQGEYADPVSGVALRTFGILLGLVAGVLAAVPAGAGVDSSKAMQFSFIFGVPALLLFAAGVTKPDGPSAPALLRYRFNPKKMLLGAGLLAGVPGVFAGVHLLGFEPSKHLAILGMVGFGYGAYLLAGPREAWCMHCQAPLQQIHDASQPTGLPGVTIDAGKSASLIGCRQCRNVAIDAIDANGVHQGEDAQRRIQSFLSEQAKPSSR